MWIASYWMPVLIGSALGLLVGGAVAVYRIKFGRNARGIQALNAGQYDQATRWFGEIVDAGRTKTLAYRTALLNRAVAHIDGGRPQEAMEDLNAAKPLIPDRNKLLRAAWLFNHAYGKVVLGDLEGVAEEIALLEQLDPRPLRAHVGRLQVAFAARRGDFDEAARVAHRQEVDGAEETVPRARRLALTLHAFVLSQLPNADAHGEKIASLIAQARGIDAPAPTGLAVAWPALGAFLNANDLG